MSYGNIRGIPLGPWDKRYVFKPKKKFSDEELLGRLRKLAQELGYSPSRDEIREGHRQGKCASVGAFEGHFVTLNAALRRAGLVPRHRVIFYEKGDVREAVLRLYQELGRSLRERDIIQASKEGKCPSPGAIRRHYGSLKECFLVLGVRRIRG